MISDDKSNCNVIGGIINTTAARSLNSGFSTKNYNPLHNIGCGNNSNNSSGVGLEINVNGVNICNEQYISDINLLDVNGGNNVILPRGRLPKIQKQMECDGVAVSFTSE